MNRAKGATDAVKSREIIRETIESFLGLALGTPQYFAVEIEVGEKTTQFIVDIDQCDFGRLLGTKGKNICALRTLVSAMASAQGFRAIVAIKDEARFF